MPKESNSHAGEPTVRIPVRLALRMTRYLNYFANTHCDSDEPAYAVTKDMVSEAVNAISNGCSMEDLRIAQVALKLEENRIPDLPQG